MSQLLSFLFCNFAVYLDSSPMRIGYTNDRLKQTRENVKMKFCSFHKVNTVLIAMFISLVACNRSNQVTEYYSKIQEAEDLISQDKNDEALSLLFELENNLDETIPDTLKYKVLS